MNIHQCISKFCELGYVAVGRGYAHPFLPDEKLRDEINGFLDTYPWLRQDEGYIAFLNAYAGASMNRPDDEVMIDIFGFSSLSSHILELEGNIIDENEFMLFGYVFIRTHEKGVSEEHEVDFAFDASGRRQYGVYKAKKNEAGEFIYTYFVPSFIKWFEYVLETIKLKCAF